MGQIHGQIFGKDVVKVCLRHALYVRKRRAQIERRGEVAIAPAQVDRAKLAGKVVDLREKAFCGWRQVLRSFRPSRSPEGRFPT